MPAGSCLQSVDSNHDHRLKTQTDNANDGYEISYAPCTVQWQHNRVTLFIATYLRHNTTFNVIRNVKGQLGQNQALTQAPVPSLVTDENYCYSLWLGHYYIILPYYWPSFCSPFAISLFEIHRIPVPTQSQVNY